MADAQTTERDLDQADQRTDSRFEEQQRETVRQGQQLIAIEKLIAQNDKHHKDRMARYEANQEKIFEQLEARLLRTTSITKTTWRVTKPIKRRYLSDWRRALSRTPQKLQIIKSK